MRPYKLFDERGLYLLVQPNGGRRWRLKYRVAGREKLLAIGVYPDVSLANARERREQARQLLANQVDPNARKKAERQAQSSTFEVVAREWLELQRPGLTPKTFAKKLGWFEDFLFPYIGRHPIAQITSPDLLAALKRIEARGHRETAHRARSSAGNVFRYAISTGRAERDLSTDLRGALAPVVTTNRAAITDPARIGQLMRAIHAYREKPICSAKASLRSGVRRSSSMTRRSDFEYAKKASISKPLKSRGNAPRPRYVDSQSFMFCRWAPQYAHRISGQQVLDQPWGNRCQALELPRESSGTFGAGSGWLLRLTTDQMRRERGG